MDWVHAIDAILALTVLEAAGLWLYRRRTGRGPAPARVLPMLVAGFALLLAIRLALSGAAPVWFAAALALAGAAHLLDLKGRWPRP